MTRQVGPNGANSVRTLGRSSRPWFFVPRSFRDNYKMALRGGTRRGGVNVLSARRALRLGCPYAPSRARDRCSQTDGDPPASVGPAVWAARRRRPDRQVGRAGAGRGGGSDRADPADGPPLATGPIQPARTAAAWAGASPDGARLTAEVPEQGSGILHRHAEPPPASEVAGDQRCRGQDVDRCGRPGMPPPSGDGAPCANQVRSRVNKRSRAWRGDFLSSAAASVQKFWLKATISRFSGSESWLISANGFQTRLDRENCGADWRLQSQEGPFRPYASSLRSRIATRNCQPSKLISMRPNSSHDTS